MLWVVGVTGGAKLDPIFRRLWLHGALPICGATALVVVASSIFLQGGGLMNVRVCIGCVWVSLLVFISLYVWFSVMHLGRVRYTDNSSVTHASNSRFLCSTG